MQVAHSHFGFWTGNDCKLELEPNAAPPTSIAHLASVHRRQQDSITHAFLAVDNSLAMDAICAFIYLNRFSGVQVRFMYLCNTCRSLLLLSRRLNGNT
ncbi:hypothetical protein LIA77_07429 [Sarocladium implicatum]|nr:hypothetical protein LIA77_07429 [Sarocladium implicatum]